MTTEERYNLLVDMDEIVRACCDLYPIHAIWNTYGGGRKGIAEETIEYREEIASDSEKFSDAMYAFVICLLYDRDWISDLKELKRE